MQNSHRPTAIAKSKQEAGTRLKQWLAGSAILVGAAICAGQALADGHTTVAHGFSNYGEMKLPSDFAHLPYVNPEAPKGGEIAIWAQGTFDSMNPYATQDGRAGTLASIGVERIVQATADEVGVVYCFLCTTMEYPDDKSWVIFNLRPEITFYDGTPATAHDVVFSHNILIEQGTASFASVVGDMIPLVEALDDHTVKFHFSPDYAPTDTISQAGATPLLSQKWFEDTGARLDESRDEFGLTSGPYLLDSFDTNRRITYKRNPDYWGNDIPFNIGRHNFDTVRVEYFADSTAAFEAFKAGEFTFRQESSSLTWATGYDFPALNDGHVVRKELPDGTLPNAVGFLFNMAEEKFADLRVRQAIALMYNFTWTNETLQYGLFQQRESFWQGSQLAATGVPEGRELELLQGVADMIDPSVLTDEVTVPHTSSAGQLDRRNLRSALALLAEAGFEAGDDGMMRKDGQTLDVEFLSVSPTFDRIVLPYIDNLKRLGVNATYNRVDPAQYTERTRAHDFDMIYSGYTVGLEEGESLGQRFGSSGVGDVFNPASYSNLAVDALIDEIVKAETYEDMAVVVRAIDRIMRRDLFVIPAWYLGKYWTAYYDMYEHPEVLPPYDLGYLDFWWYNAEKGDAIRASGALR